MKHLIISFGFLFVVCNAFCQDSTSLSFLTPADSFHKGRFWTCTAAGTAIYTATSIGLYQAWYSEYELTRFHTFDDWGEWNDMDKMGHAITTYNEAKYSFDGLRWTGTSHNKSVWLAVGVGMLLQSTVEVMDGFSAKWGYSWADTGFNLLGVTVFAAQEIGWQEQRIRLKISNSLPSYPNLIVYPTTDGPPTTVRARATDLYGSSFAEKALKDYNGMTTWASVNIASFSRQEQQKFPGWLNVAFGYGANNMLGGYDNTWTEDSGLTYTLSDDIYPRYRQFYLSFDVDLNRIPVKKRWAKAILSALNWIKIPSPTLEYNTLGKVRFHPFYW